VQNVVVDGSSVGAQTSFTFNNVTANHTISASFAINTFTITASAGSGGTISPSSGFHVANVLVDGASQGAVTSFTFNNVTANHSIAASFAADAATFTLAVSTAGSGTVTKTPDLASYTSGSTVQLSAVPAVGNHFVAWSGDASGSVNPLTVTMD